MLVDLVAFWEPRASKTKLKEVSRADLVDHASCYGFGKVITQRVMLPHLRNNVEKEKEGRGCRSTWWHFRNLGRPRRN